MKTAAKQMEARPNPRMTAEDRRQQILDVAVLLFSQKGFRGTTTKEIAQAAGVNEAIIFRHFATKRDLYTAIMDCKANSAENQAKEQALQEAMGTCDDRSLFETVAFQLLEFHDHDDAALRVLMYSALEGHELAEMIFQTHVVDTHQKLADYVERRIGEGAFRRVDPMLAVRSFLGTVMNHAMFYKFFNRHARQLLDVTNRQAAERFTDFFLASLTNHDYPTIKPCPAPRKTSEGRLKLVKGK